MTVSSVLAFRALRGCAARAFRRMAAAGLDVLRRDSNPRAWWCSRWPARTSCATGNPLAVVIDNSAAMQALTALGQNPFRRRARNARTRSRREGAGRDHRLCDRAAAASRRAAVHHAADARPRWRNSSRPTRRHDQTTLSTLLSNLASDTRLRQVIFRRRTPLAAPVPAAYSSDRGRRPGGELRDRIVRAAARSPWGRPRFTRA